MDQDATVSPLLITKQGLGTQLEHSCLIAITLTQIGKGLQIMSVQLQSANYCNLAVPVPASASLEEETKLVALFLFFYKSEFADIM